MKKGDIIKTKYGELEVANVMELVNPLTLEKELCVTVWYYGKERKICNDDILNG